MVLPNVMVAGGGPAGLLCALLLARRGLDVSVCERDLKADEWSPRSFSINLQDRGINALKAAGLYEAVREKCVYKSETVRIESDGKTVVVPFSNPRMSVTRPLLVQCITQQLEKEGRVRLRRGVSVEGLSRSSKSETLDLRLSDGSVTKATHLVGADGKFSAIRSAAAKIQQEEGGSELSFTLRTEPSFALMLPLIDAQPIGWRKGCSHSLLAKTLVNDMFSIAAPLPDGRISVGIQMYDDILKPHPWLLPPEGRIDKDWIANSEQPDSAEWGEKLSALIAAELPQLAAALPGLVTAETLTKTQRLRRTSWVEVTSGRFDALHGRVALIGDAAHSMTSILAQGCNCAMESAVALDTAVGRQLVTAGAGAGAAPTATVAALSAAFTEYGLERPGAVREPQQQSAAASRKISVAAKK